MELPYNVIPVNIGLGDQFKPEFLKISPNNRIPAIVDRDPIGGGPPLEVFETGAILLYLPKRAAEFRRLRGADRLPLCGRPPIEPAAWGRGRIGIASAAITT